MCHNHWSPRTCASQEKPLQWEVRVLNLGSSPCSLQLKKSPCSNEDPEQSEKKKKEFISIFLAQTLKAINQFISVTQSCPTLWDPMDCRTPGLPVHHQVLELAQSHVHRDSDVVQPSHPLSYPSPPIFNLSQHQGLFKWVSSLHKMAKVWEFQLQRQSFQWTSRTDLL